MSVWLPRAQHQKVILLASISQRTRFASTLALRRHQITARATPPGILFAATRFESTVAQPTSQDPKPSPPAPKEEAPLLSRAWKKVKHEAQHYWHGSKLLVSEVRISSRLQWKILHGDSLTRRERRQVRVFRSCRLGMPMNGGVYLVEANHAGLAQARPVRRVRHRAFHGTATARGTEAIPQYAPFYIRRQIRSCKLSIYLRTRPYSYASHQQEEKQRKLLRVRLEMAKFLQETLRESGLKANAHIVGSDAFKEFFLKVRSTGESPSTQDVVNVAKLFDDDLTLDNLSRPQLVSMCRYMCINAFGTDNFLRGAIRSRLTNLRRDDQAIDTEGVDSLSFSELQGACQSRGIRTTGVSPARLRDELSTWINLHLHNRVSGVLLILGRAFHFDRKPGEDEDGKTTVIKSIESVLSGLPDNLVGCHLPIVVQR